MKFVLAVLFLVLGSCSAFSEYVIMGLGSNSCGKFADMYKKDPPAENWYFYWTQGYMSAFNNVSIAAEKPWRDLSAMSVEAQAAHIRRYCDQHPLEKYIDAVHNLLGALPLKGGK